MDKIVRAKYVITEAAAGEEGLITDSAVVISGGKIVEVGEYNTLKKMSPKAVVKGNGKQLLMPGLIDGHTHG